MKLRRWLKNPIVIAALVEFVILAIVVFLVLTRTQGAPHV
jgi:large-conductance mechanosensitive channel